MFDLRDIFGKIEINFYITEIASYLPIQQKDNNIYEKLYSLFAT